MNITGQTSPASSTDEFARWVDPTTGREYVLVPAEQFQRIRSILDGIERRAGWDEPALDVYEQYRKRP